MNVNQIRIFEAVSRYLNMTRAAESLDISEPSVFQQVKSLEEYCGVRLYRRVGRQIELTREGRLVQADLREILLRVERLGQRFKRSTAYAEGGSLIVGGSHGPSVSLLPSLLVKFKESHPNAQVVLRTKSTRNVERLILQAQVQIGLVTNPSSSPTLHTIPYRQEKIVIVVSVSHPLARKNELTLAELAQGPLIVKESRAAKSCELLKQLEDQGWQPNILMECESAEAIKTAAVKGQGLGILYQDHVQVRRGQLKIVKVPGLRRIESQTFIIYLKEKPLSQNARDFLALLQRPPQKMERVVTHTITIA
jgi:LysR family transcriptional regulator, hydrogen peroxide-inducible genes activator